MTKRAAATARAIRLIRAHNPVSPEAFKKLGLSLEFIDSGVFRKVYGIRGADLVVKMPSDDMTDLKESIQHSASEMRRIKRLGTVKELAPHLPKIFHYDKKSGVIVMKKYPTIEPLQQAELLGIVIKKLVRRVAGIQMGDIHDGNIKRKRKGWDSVIFVDLGY